DSTNLGVLLSAGTSPPSFLPVTYFSKPNAFLSPLPLVFADVDGNGYVDVLNEKNTGAGGAQATIHVMMAQ
ncbi:MAG: hypothetical protein ACKV2T_31080, partial [Kofleriaceae bacterium]